MLMILGMIGREMEAGDKKENFGCWIKEGDRRAEAGDIW